jgi:glucose/mannose transport system permease protein
MNPVLYWIVFGALIGSLGTYLLYDYRRQDAQTGAVVGALAGAVGNLVLLIPLWVYTYTQNRYFGVQTAAVSIDTTQLALSTGTAEVTATRAKPQSIVLKRLMRVLLYAFLIGMVIVYLMPIYTVVTTSLKTPQEAGKLDKVWELPSTLHWESYSTALEELGPKLRNSFLLTVNATVLSAVMGSMNGYVLSKWKFPGANIVFPLMLFGMFIPYQSILIPLFQFMHDVNLGGTLTSLILAHVVYGLPITTLIFRNYYAEVPTEMLEAGQIDGAGFFGLYRKIVFPLSLPGFVVVIIWQFTQIWNEFLFAVTLTNQKSQPITVALALLAGGEAVNWNLPMAGAMLAALPTLVVYIVLGRYFIRGLLAGSVKG